MHYEERRRSPWPVVLIMTIPIVSIAGLMWWMETRFGSTAALMALGALIGVVCVTLGIVLAMANQKTTLANAAQFNADLASVERSRSQTQRAELGVYREHAKGEREAFNHRAKLEEINRKEVHRLARQQAQLMIGAEREQQQAQSSRSWAQAEPAETIDGDFRFYE